MMKKTIIILFLFFPFLTQSQVTFRNLLSGKYGQDAIKQSLIPKDQFKPFPKTPEEWGAAVPDSILTGIVKKGETLLTFDFTPISATVFLDYVRSGDRERYQRISYGKRNALMGLVLAESIENKGRFTETIMNGIWSICEESYWGVAAHIGGSGLPDPEKPVVDLFTAETAAVLSLVDYYTGEKLDKINKMIRKRIYYETNKRFFSPLFSNPEQYGWMSKTKPVNNWNPWIMSNYITAILLLEKDENRRDKMIQSSLAGLDSYINGLGEDGGCDEGPSYWFAAGASVYDCLEMLSIATNGTIDIYQEPLIQKMGAFIYKTHIAGNYFVNFADADPKLNLDGLLLFRFGKALKDEKMMQLGQWAFQKYPSASGPNSSFFRSRMIENLLTIKNTGNEMHPYEPVKDAWCGDIQVLTARSGNGLFLAAHGGHNAESHNHNDVGDFILYANGEPVIIDAGRGNYTARTFSDKRYELWFTQSQYHNLPVVDGFGQNDGREFMANHVVSRINDKEASLSMDIASAYCREAGILSWNRKVILNRIKNNLEIEDEYLLEKKPFSLQQVFMTVCAIDFSRPGNILLTTPLGQSVSILYNPALWSVSTDLPSTDGMEYASFKTKWDDRPVQRIILTGKALLPKGKYKFTIELEGGKSN
jgi:hypothetical protein